MNKALSEQELKLISALQQTPLATQSELARRTRGRVSSVQYFLEKLRSERGLMIRPAINSYALGLQNVAVFFTPNISTRSDMSRFEKVIEEHPKIPWCGEFIGDFQFGITIHCKQLQEVKEVLREVAKAARVSFAQRNISPRSSYEYFSRKYLEADCRKYKKLVHLEHRFPEQSLEADELDKRIMSYLSRESFQSLREVARALEEPHATVDRRVKRLEEKGVISGHFVEIPVHYLGRSSYRLMIASEQLELSDEEDMRNYFAELPECVYLNETLGSFDRELIIEVTSPADVSRIVRDIYARFGSAIRALRPLTVARVLKWRLF